MTGVQTCALPIWAGGHANEGGGPGGCVTLTVGQQRRIEGIGQENKRHAERAVARDGRVFDEPVERHGAGQRRDFLEAVRAVAEKVHPGHALRDDAAHEVGVEVVAEAVGDDGVESVRGVGVGDLRGELLAGAVALRFQPAR